MRHAEQRTHQSEVRCPMSVVRLDDAAILTSNYQMTRMDQMTFRTEVSRGSH